MSEAVVVGAGVVGACCALALQQRGVAVTLVDRSAPGEACSFGNSGSFGVGLIAPHATPGTVRRIPQLWCGRDEPLALNLRHLPAIFSWGRRFIAASRRVDALAAARSALLSRAYDAWDELFDLAAAGDLIKSAGMIFAFSHEDGPQRIDWLVSLARRHGVVIERISGDEARRMNPSLGAINRPLAESFSYRCPRDLSYVCHRSGGMSQPGFPGPPSCGDYDLKRVLMP